MLVKDGKLDHLKNGPIYWVDSADVNPCMGEVVRVLCEHFTLLPSPLPFIFLLSFFRRSTPLPSSPFLPPTLLPPPSRHCCSSNVDHTLQRSSLPLGPSSQRNQLHWTSQWGHGIHSTQVLWRFSSSKCICVPIVTHVPLPCGYVTSVLGCVYACVYDSVCFFGGIRRHSETKSYLMAVFTMGELVLLSVCALCTLDSTGNVSSEYTPPGAS